MTITPLPTSPNLENLKKRAKTLLKSVRAGDRAALDRVGPYFGDPAQISLQHAQLVIARGHGFSSWVRLKAHVRGHADHSADPDVNRFLDLVCLVYGSEPDFGPKRFAKAATLLEQVPAIAEASIYTAAAMGDADRVLDWLDRDASLLNAPGGMFHWPPLMYAAYARLPGRSSWPAGAALLQRGADPNAHYMWGGQYKFTALTGVFGQGEGGVVNQPEHPDMIPFARTLLEQGANANDSQACYNRCFTPDNTCLELLLEFGLSVDDKNNWLLHDNDQLIPHPSETLYFQLMQAIHRGYPTRAALMIEHGVDIHKPDDTYATRTKGKTPYQAACLMGQDEIAQMLAQAGAATDLASDVEAFEVACMAGNFDRAQAFLDKDQRLKEQVDARMMLCDAVKLRNVAALEVMIQLGFEMNHGHERTPLHEAALTGDVTIVDRLLEAGADATLREAQYLQPALGWALHTQQSEVVARLDAAPMDIFTAAARGNLEQLQAHLTADPTQLERRFETLRPGDTPSGNDWLTPLAYATGAGQVTAMQFLLGRGANVNVTDEDGQSLIDLASAHSNPEVLTLVRQYMK